MKRSRKGFTLVEILIVVIILGILAAIVIPQFTQASTEARLSNLKTNLQTVRTQLLLYKTQHNEAYPDSNFSTQMVLFSDISGGTATAGDSTHTFGPYLQAVPVNPLSNSSAIRVVTGNATAFSAPSSDAGWYYNSDTGEFRADLKDTWVAADGSKYNTF
jgi:general secretion pathway protein G